MEDDDRLTARVTAVSGQHVLSPFCYGYLITVTATDRFDREHPLTRRLSSPSVTVILH